MYVKNASLKKSLPLCLADLDVRRKHRDGKSTETELPISATARK
jgi:hypothetical protein